MKDLQDKGSVMIDVPAGTAIRFEPGVAQRVALVPLGGTREVYGLSLTPPGKLDG